MSSILARLGALILVTFASLWSKSRLLFAPRATANGTHESDIETGITINRFDDAPSEDKTQDTVSLADASSRRRYSMHTRTAVSVQVFRHPSPSRSRSVKPSSLFGGQGLKNQECIVTPIHIPLKTITKKYGNLGANVDVHRRPRSQTLKHVQGCPDLRARSQSPSPTSAPGSLGWESDKLKLLDEAREWNTRVQSEFAARRGSLSVPVNSLPTSEALSNVRRTSAPANLGGHPLSVEERLPHTVSDFQNHTAVPEESQSNSGEPIEGDTCVAGSSISETGDISALNFPHHSDSELPYLHSTCPFPSSGSLNACESAGTLTEMIDALEAMFSTSKWRSLVDLEGAAAREEARRREMVRIIV
ncbi:hypothetical protein B0H11DRAFT_1908957 [Mycena galericulata]|nr:hypothetical protein B0H11DRAFT_1908957 [Mycena galericulata]